MSGERVLGVDACKTGWVGIVLSGDATTAHAAATIGQLVGAARLDGQVDVVAIDMPIGLPDAADVRASWASAYEWRIGPDLFAQRHPARDVSRSRPELRRWHRS